MLCNARGYQFSYRKLGPGKSSTQFNVPNDIRDNAFERNINLSASIRNWESISVASLPGFGVNRYGPIIASARSDQMPWPSIEINRLVESREKTGKARHRLVMSSWSTLFRSSGFSWMKRSRVAPRDVTTCCYPLPSLLCPSPCRHSPSPNMRARASGCCFSRVMKNIICICR